MRLMICWLGAFLLVGATHAQFQFRGPPPQQREQIAVPGGYLPPVPEETVCMPITRTSTYTSTQTSVVTSYVQGPGGEISTYFRTVESVLPTSILNTNTVTRTSTATQFITSINLQDVTSTYIATDVGDASVITVSSTVIFPETVVSQIISTIRSSTFVTRTTTDRDVTTVVRPVTSTKTDQIFVTDFVPVPGQDVTRSVTETSFITTTVQTQPPPVTVTQTRTSESLILTTTVVQPPPQKVTLTETSTRLDQVTRTSTVKDAVTKTQKFTSTIASDRTVVETRQQIITSTFQVVTTRQSTVTSTAITTQLSQITIASASVVTRTVTQPAVFRTQTEQVTITQGRPGVQTSTVYITTTVQRIVTVTGDGGQVTVTRTVTPTDCGQTGYNYNPPAVPFEF